MGLFLTVIVAGAALVAYMATHGVHDIVASVEHEVAEIRRESGRGWTTRRILRHHRSFCACQVDYLRKRAGV